MKKRNITKYERDPFIDEAVEALSAVSIFLWFLVPLAIIAVPLGIWYLLDGTRGEKAGVYQSSPSQATGTSLEVYQASIDAWVESVDEMLNIIQGRRVSRLACERFFDVEGKGAETRYSYIFTAYDDLSPSLKEAARESFNATRAKYKDVFEVVNAACRGIGS